MMSPSEAILVAFIAAATAMLALPTVSDVVSLVTLLCSSRQRRSAARLRRPPDTYPRLLFLVPAHDEEMLIEGCVRSLRRMQYPQECFAVTVIADNCTDRTARFARAAGAGCLERCDPVQPGKPRAIAWALERIPLAHYDGCVIIDADTVVDPGFAAELATRQPLRNKVVQGYNGVRNRTDSALTRMAAVLADVNYCILYPLKAQAGLNVPLRGTGVCIGTDVLARYRWNAFTIGEDWELYALVTLAGVPVELAPNARMYAQEARSLRQGASQRRRWTAGKLTVLGRLAPRIVRNGCVTLRQRLDLLAELSAPGPIVQLGIASTLAGVTLTMRPAGMVWMLLLLVAPIARMGLSAVLALRRDPHPAATWRAFAFLPVYAVWRVLVELTAVQMLGDAPWIRTRRHEEPNGRGGGAAPPYDRARSAPPGPI